MKALLAALVIALIQGSGATLLIRGNPEVALAGKPYSVECLLEDSEYSIDNVHMEQYFGNEWRSIGSWGYRCFSRTMRTEDKLMLKFFFMSPRQLGPYRCVLDGPNVTAAEYTEPLNITVHYLYGPWLSREGDRGTVNDILTVRESEDVVLKCKAESSEELEFFWYKQYEDWILPSSVLTLNNVSFLDEGSYTCTVRHPTIPSLTRNSTIELSVLTALQYNMWKLEKTRSYKVEPREKERERQEMSSYLDGDSQIILLTVGGVLACLVAIISMTTFFCFCAKKVKTSKGPIDDHSAKKPIYKSSLESVPSTCTDKQPLV
ncbi:hypothetical protein NL108_000192 [Boleophthalmus pectinirostris]|uniref:uncharacterized protein si:ch211-79k12.1 n=1 Tax=Boleophthalmus pectinirostris TaxID=150288 RepID=UPI000A1C6BE1|nr:uncharacterized protein si:ch211-79k12.1 [Boleophthalmus pectinirostris]KAJ0065938.1 hypothetical protein NL108_000192 [Boleophthalmus pectinirostris]